MLKRRCREPVERRSQPRTQFHPGYGTRPLEASNLAKKRMGLWVGGLRRSTGLIDFQKWLGERIMVERLAAPQRPPAPEQSQERHKSARPTVFATTTTETRKCIICKGSHHVESYQKFQGIPLEKRASNVKKHLLCFSCLTQGHRAKDCRKKKTCQIDECKGKHHPLLNDAPRVFSSKESAVAPFTGTT